ncbi:hypothetical protein TRFO_27195 [Tritrichomonas foetus]|uniref:Uncharacterized protein n=1 Tax=Tritrichomonas foetus TaxID=1144522 RepID=A0A1J4K1R3_9EUKA|nr:hypothetical protein TRFO_27195 [Tritrichomonas foetus]|eukprot:OHT05179.1 hypothetical protein TRFO_27195 [Tritrichomonas foetus]
MKPQLLYTDLGFSIPALLLPFGKISKKGWQFIKLLTNEPLLVDSNTDFEKICLEKNIVVPQSLNAKIYTCQSPTEIKLIKQRLWQETQLFFLKCYIVIIFVDYGKNEDVKSAQELTKFLFNDEDFPSLIFYRASEAIIQLHSDETHISFANYKDDIASANFRQFLTNRILASIKSKISSLVSNSSSSKASRYALQVLSTEKKDIVNSFIHLNKRTKQDSIQFASLLEQMGLYETENPGQLRELKIIDRYTTERLVNMREEYYNNDLYYIYSVAASIYMKNNKFGKALDCIFRILAATKDQDLVSECVRIITRNNEDQSVILRTWELLAHMFRLNMYRKIPLFTFLLAKTFQGNTRIEFQERTLNFLYNQPSGPLIIRDICFPIIMKLISDSCQLDSMAKTRMAFKFLSVSGQILSKRDQERLFMFVINSNLGDLRIPCNLGLRAQNHKFVESDLTYRKISKSQEIDSSPFKYSYLKAADDKNSIVTAVGYLLRVEIEIFNPFAIPLPVSFSASPNDFYQSKDHPFVLKPKQFSYITFCITPLCEGTLKINGIEAILSSGCQHIDLLNELNITVIDRVAEFNIRTNLPINQTMNLFDGEVVDVKLWLSNNGSYTIQKLDMKANNVPIDKFELPIHPYCQGGISFPMTIDRTMTQINLNLVAQTENQEVESVTHIIQQIKTESAISISGINILNSIPEIDTDFSKLIFIAVDIQNTSSSVFNYNARFNAAAELGFDFPGIVTKKGTSGILSAFETTAFILAVEKDQILSDSIVVKNARFINARRDEEERINHKLTSQERKDLNDRVKVAVFIEQNLIFKWSCGVGRNGVLAVNTALPSIEVMREIQLRRPKLIHSFDMHPIIANKRITLNVKFEEATIQSCRLDLGIYRDSDYGIAWEQSLDRVSNETNEFNFVLFFTKPDHFDFILRYETDQKVKGHTCIEVDVVDCE